MQPLNFINLSINDNTEVENWDFSLSAQDFLEKYLLPYIKTTKISEASKPTTVSTFTNTYSLSNGVTFSSKIFIPASSSGQQGFAIFVDINGKQNPNVLGRDKFTFYIFQEKKNYYNTGYGDCVKNIPRGGLYPDGYGFSRDRLLNDGWRGCNKKKDSSSSGYKVGSAGNYCTALIMLDGWKISPDYLW